VKVGVGTGGTKWPKALQFMVKLRGDEDAEDAVRRWLFSERGQLHAAQASGERSTGTLCYEYYMYLRILELLVS
jgi:hypothetical protein